MPPRLFVYGTLRSGNTNLWARLLHANATLLGPATIRARIHHFRRYPAIRRAQHQQVTGELWQLKSPAIFPALDRYEGRNYRRITIQAQLGPRRVLAQVYEWRHPL